MSGERLCSRPGCPRAAVTPDGHCDDHDRGGVLRAKMRETLMLIADAMRDSAQGFTCSEADAIEGLYREAGLSLLADDFIAAHAAGDEETDDHYNLGERVPSLGEALASADEASR